MRFIDCPQCSNWSEKIFRQMIEAAPLMEDTSRMNLTVTVEESFANKPLADACLSVHSPVLQSGLSTTESEWKRLRQLTWYGFARATDESRVGGSGENANL